MDLGGESDLECIGGNEKGFWWKKGEDFYLDEFLGERLSSGAFLGGIESCGELTLFKRLAANILVMGLEAIGAGGLMVGADVCR